MFSVLTGQETKWLILNGVDGLDALMFAGGIKENAPIIRVDEINNSAFSSARKVHMFERKVPRMCKVIR